MATHGLPCSVLLILREGKQQQQHQHVKRWKAPSYNNTLGAMGSPTITQAHRRHRHGKHDMANSRQMMRLNTDSLQMPA